MIDISASLPSWAIALENAMVAPFVAALTFIGSMGNIPLATVLNSNGVLFAGIMGFIYSDLMVPPLVAVNAKYYGKKVALYIAVVMYISIVITALILNGIFSIFSIVPESNRVVSEVAQFKIDYTFYFNILFTLIAGYLIYLNKKFIKIDNNNSSDMDMETSSSLKRKITYLFIIILLGGLVLNLFM